MSKSASGAWDKLEQVFEERVSKSLNRLGVPTYNDIQALSKQVDQLNASVQELAQGRWRRQEGGPRQAPTQRGRQERRHAPPEHAACSERSPPQDGPEG